MESPDTLRDAILWFADFEHCRQFMIELRWPDGLRYMPVLRCREAYVASKGSRVEVLRETRTARRSP